MSESSTTGLVFYGAVAERYYEGKEIDSEHRGILLFTHYNGSISVKDIKIGIPMEVCRYDRKGLISNNISPLTFPMALIADMSPELLKQVGSALDNLAVKLTEKAEDYAFWDNFKRTKTTKSLFKTAGGTGRNYIDIK